MYKKVEKTELCQISLTGVRAIILVGLLIEAPRSIEEIREIFIKFNIMEPSHSNDILRIDINTLRKMGCEISKANAKTNYKYILSNHPFAFNITSDEITMLKKVYKKVYKKVINSNDFNTILSYDELFKKIANYVNTSDEKEALYGLSILKSFDIGIIKELHADCCARRTLKLIYNNPDNKINSEKEIIAEKLVFQNDKIYLYGIDLNKKEAVTLNIKRIKTILSRFLKKDNTTIEPITVKFFLKNFGITGIENNEKIIANTNNGYLIEGQYYNEFVAIQRLLAFGDNCTIISPEDIKTKIIKNLKDMWSTYDD